MKAIWMLDVAREQCLTMDHLRQFAAFTREAGYDALGLYLEHRFAYPSSPGTHGLGAITPNMAQSLAREFPDIEIIPFVNLLGHFEGWIYTAAGEHYAEEPFLGLQACPTNQEFHQMVKSLLDDVIDAFPSQVIHIGGDETYQLGRCPQCRGAVEHYERVSGRDGKAALYADFMAPLARYVIERGRRPAVWGDMFIDHPQALAALPKETLIFDWQYFSGCRETSSRFLKAGFEVVGCPALQTYNALWMHLPESEQNVRDVARDVHEIGATGVCVTTWEHALFGAVDTLLPAVAAARTLIDQPDAPDHHMVRTYGPKGEPWAQLMGVELPKLGAPFEHSKTRSSLKVRLLLQADPFLAWRYHRQDLCGETGEAALALFEKALHVAPNEATKGVTLFGRAAVDFVRQAESAQAAYTAGKPAAAIAALAAARRLFEDLESIAAKSHRRIGGSLADIERCRVARSAVETVMRRVRDHGDGSLGYLPSFSHLTHPRFMPHDQGAWWRVNRWAED